jgi:hypothetical protein
MSVPIVIPDNCKKLNALLKGFREFEKVAIPTVTKRAYRFDTSLLIERTIFARFPFAAARCDLKCLRPRTKERLSD